MLHYVIPLVVGIMGVAVGYGALRNQAKENTEKIERLAEAWGELIGNPGTEPVFIRRGECDKRSKNIETRIDELQRATRKLQNFARWQLAHKENLGADQIDEILNGG